MIRIEKNIPLPKPRNNWKVQLDKMEVGDSFPFEKRDRNKVANSISINFHNGTDKRFTISDDPKDSDNGRVWRIE